MTEEEKKASVLLINFNNDSNVKKLRRYFNDKSFLEILHIDRKENYHSRFLKWLFEDSETFEFANESLISLIIKRSSKQHKSFPNHIEKELLSGGFKANSSKVVLEDTTEEGRCDIIITLSYQKQDDDKEEKLYIIIENKVDSTEHKAGRSNKEQTSQYYSYYTNSVNYKDGEKFFVFLTPLDTVTLNGYSKPECDCGEFTQINYQDLLDNILSPLSTDEYVSQRKRFIIREYIKALSINYTQNIMTNTTTAMAISDEFRDILKKFLDKNWELIKLSIDAKQNDPSITKEDQDKLKKANKQLTDFMTTPHFLFDGKILGPGRLIKEIVKKYIQSNSNPTIQELQKMFPPRMRSVKSKKQIVIDQDVFDKEKSKKSWKTIDDDNGHGIKDKSGKTIYVYIEWDKNNINNAISNINREAKEQIGEIKKI